MTVGISDRSEEPAPRRPGYASGASCDQTLNLNSTTSPSAIT